MPTVYHFFRDLKIDFRGQNGFEIDIFAMLSFQPSANTAAAIGLFTTLLAVDDQINKPLISGWLALPFSPGIVAAAGNFKYTAH